MTDENNSQQGNNNPNNPPAPEIVELNPKIVQKGGTGSNLMKIIEIILKLTNWLCFLETSMSGLPVDKIWRQIVPFLTPSLLL